MDDLYARYYAELRRDVLEDELELDATVDTADPVDVDTFWNGYARLFGDE